MAEGDDEGKGGKGVMREGKETKRVMREWGGGKGVMRIGEEAKG